MPDVFQYYGRFQSVRGGFGSLPPWARSVVTIFALPGLILAGLSLVLLSVSILALFLLTVPAYRLLRGITGASRPAGSSAIPTASSMFETDPSPGRKPVQVRVVE